MPGKQIRAALVTAIPDTRASENALLVLLQGPEDGQRNWIAMTAEVALALIGSLQAGVGAMMKARAAKGLPLPDLAQHHPAPRLEGFDVALGADLTTARIVFRLQHCIETHATLPLEDLRRIRRSLERALKAAENARTAARARRH
ncbi:MAG: hypothetical protein AB7F35_06490 [Acetobacteraceae bacterium]